MIQDQEFQNILGFSVKRKPGIFSRYSTQIQKRFAMCKGVFFCVIRESGLLSDTLILKHLKQTHYPIFRLCDLFIEEEGGGSGESGDVFPKGTSPLLKLNYDLLRLLILRIKENSFLAKLLLWNVLQSNIQVERYFFLIQFFL